MEYFKKLFNAIQHSYVYMSLQSTVFPFCEPTLTHFSSCIPHSETAFFSPKIRFTHENWILFLHVTSKIKRGKITKSTVINLKLVNIQTTKACLRIFYLEIIFFSGCDIFLYNHSTIYKYYFENVP